MRVFRKSVLFFFSLFLPFCLHGVEKRVIAVVPKHFPPQYFLDKNNRPAGFAIDMIEETAKSAGYKIEYLVAEDWPDVWAIFKSGKADIIPNLGISESRKKVLDFTAAMETFAISAFKRRASADIRSAENIKDHKAGVVEFNVGVAMMQNHPKELLFLYKNFNEAMAGLLTAEIDVLVYPSSVANKIILKAGLDDMVVEFGKPLEEIVRAIGVRKGDKLLYNELNGALQELLKSKRFEEIYSKWYAKPRGFFTAENILKIVVSLIALIIFVMAFWRYYYIKKINHRLNILLDEQKKLQDDILQSKKNLEEVQRITHLGSWEYDIIHDSLCWSDEVYRIFGLKKGEFEADYESFMQCVHHDDVKSIENAYKRSLDDGKAYDMVYRIIRGDDSSVRYLWEKCELEKDSKGSVVRSFGSVQDITERKLMEKELKQKEELMMAQSRQAAMGDMIAMIAHQWRQPITVIAMVANNIKLDIELEEEIPLFKLENMADLISEQTQHLSKTIDDFRDFFKPNKEKEETTVCRVLDSVMKIVGKSLENNNIEVRIRCSCEKRIVTYANELLQVFLNIISNSKDAIKKSLPENGYIEISVFEENDTIKTLICDNGGGIPEDALKKISRPYFTTKKESGTGLGLYMSRTIVEKHLNGKITWENRDNGACFIVALPMGPADKMELKNKITERNKP